MTERIVVQDPPTNKNQDDNQRPEWCPEKFWDAEKGEVNAEGMAKSYSEMEKTSSQTKNTNLQVNQKKDDDLNNQQTIEQKVDGLDLSKYQNEFQVNGQLSDASYKELEAQGIPRVMVDGYIKGQEASATELRQEAFKITGSEENFDAMVNWAAGSLTPAEVAAYNKAIDGPKEQAMLAVQGLYSKFVQANGKNPALVSGNQPVTTGDVFQNWAQVTKAMQDPRYAKDPDYRKQVEQKLERSNPVG